MIPYKSNNPKFIGFRLMTHYYWKLAVYSFLDNCQEVFSSDIFDDLGIYSVKIDDKCYWIAFLYCKDVIGKLEFSENEKIPNDLEDFNFTNL